MSPARRRRRPAARVLSRIALAFIVLVGGALLTELVLRMRGGAGDGRFLYPPDLTGSFDPAPGVMPGIEGVSRFWSNAQGLRADPLDEDDDYRVLCVGGSTTACVYLDQEETWPARLQARLSDGDLDVWVGNAGKDGMTSRDHLLQLDAVLPVVPDLDALVLLAGVNDLLLRLSRDTAYDPTFMDREDAEEILAPRVFSVRPPPDRAWWQSLRVVGLVQAMTAEAPEEQHLLDAQGDWYELRRKLRRNAPQKLDALPDLGAGLEEFERNLSRAVSMATERGLRVVLLSQPFIWRADLPPELDRLLWLGGRGDFMNEKVEAYYTVEALAAGMTAYNAVTARVAERVGVEFVDLAAQLPQDTSIYYDDVHFNETGARAVAEVVARVFLRAPPFAE